MIPFGLCPVKDTVIVLSDSILYPLMISAFMMSIGDAPGLFFKNKKTAILYRLKSAGQLFCVLIIQGRGALYMAGAGVPSGHKGFRTGRKGQRTGRKSYNTVPYCPMYFQ